MAITRETVLKIASLARIALSEDEAARFERELSKILEFVAELGDVDTTNIEPLSGGIDLENVYREDSPGDGLPADGDSLVAAAPQRRGAHIEVPAVFDRRESR